MRNTCGPYRLTALRGSMLCSAKTTNPPPGALASQTSVWFLSMLPFISGYKNEGETMFGFLCFATVVSLWFSHDPRQRQVLLTSPGYSGCPCRTGRRCRLEQLSGRACWRYPHEHCSGQCAHAIHVLRIGRILQPVGHQDLEMRN